MGDLGKLIVATVLKSCRKSNKSPNLVTLPTTGFEKYLRKIFLHAKTREEKLIRSSSLPQNAS